MNGPLRPPAPLPFERVDYDAYAARRQEIGETPTPENSPDLFADELALEGFAAAQVEAFVSSTALLAGQLDARHAMDRALARIRERAARQWLWTNRERCRVRPGVFELPADLTADERKLMDLCRGEVVKLLRGDPDVLRWFTQAKEAESEVVTEAT